MNKGQRALTIDEVPLDWCFNPGVKFDFQHFDDAYVVIASDVEAELQRIGHDLQPLDIVVVNTSAGARYGANYFLSSGCGMGRETTLYLLDRGVRVTGTDAWSWDAPFVHTAKRYGETGDASILWEGHRASIEIGHYHIEKLAHLDQLLDSGCTIACFPWKIKGASAGFTLAVVIFEA